MSWEELSSLCRTSISDILVKASIDENTALEEEADIGFSFELEPP